MRSKIEANEYKDYILGFIFYKFLSDKEVKYLKENDWTDEYLPELSEEDSETVESIQKNLGYFIAYENLFSSWIAKGIDFSAENVTDALSAFSRLINPTHKKVFDNIFATLQTGLSKLGETSGARTKAIRDLIYLIKDIPMDGKQDYDVLGFIYEYIDAIIGLPANIFFGTGIPTIIMVLKQKRDNTDVLIVDASKGFAKAGKNNVLQACDIKRIVDVVTSRSTVEKFSKKVERDDIRANDYNLNIPRYVDSSEKAESWDIFASMFGGIPDSELQELHPYWSAFPGLKENLFASDNGAYCRLIVPDLKSSVRSHPAVVSFLSRYETAFHDFDDVLRAELLDGMRTLNTSQEETVLSDAIFSRLDGIPLVDRYGAYQLLDDEWGRIAVDLEIIQTEGFDATKQVDPNMVSKKKDGKDQEVQEGWAGHVIPFALAQEVLLPDALAALTELEARLTEISGEYETLLEELSEEDKEQDFVNEGKDAFVPAEVKKALKAKEAEPQTLAILKKAVVYSSVLSS